MTSLKEKLLKRFNEYLKEQEETFDEFAKNYQYGGYRDSGLSSFMGEIDGDGINYYVQECSEDSDYWLVAKITIKNKGKTYQLTFDCDFGFDMDSPEKLIDGIVRTEESAQETLKDFDQVER